MKKILLSLLLVALFAGAGILVFYPEAEKLISEQKNTTLISRFAERKLHRASPSDGEV